jgi:hypothetical protein
MDKLKIEKKVSVLDLNALQPGWIEMKKADNSNKILIRENKLANARYHNNEFDESKMCNVLDKLVILHKKRSEEYINNWGIDEFERMFKCSEYNNDDYYIDNEFEASSSNDEFSDYEFYD